MITSPLSDLIGIEYPIFQGGMAHISDASLAAAVSEAGGLGIITSASGDIEWLERQIDMARGMTAKPIGVNVMLMGNNVDQIAALLAEKRISVVTTGAGNPEKYIHMWKEAGIKVIPVIPSVALAKLCARSGADAVIAEGGESGGHVGDMTTMALVPQVVDAVDIPVIAAGGIADGRGMAAALMLGAVGVQIGTRFLSATECNIHENYKKKVLKANDTSTIVTGRRLGHPVRSIKSPFSRAYAKAEYSDISDEDLEQMAVGSLRAATFSGDDKKGCFLAGQIAGMVREEQTAAEIIRDIVSGAENALNGAKKWVK
ncbi:MAG: nitronate monooxygenase [Clostridia bacterium]|nr:nitronate monooxygenase [Clostridia bacterium]